MIRPLLAHPAFRFVVVGTVITILTYALYLWLLQSFSYRIAYGVSYLAGIGCSLLLHSRYVFRTRITTRTALLYPVMYFAQYLFGLGILTVSVRLLQVPAEFALAVSIALSVPLVFFASRWLMKSAANVEQPTEDGT